MKKVKKLLNFFHFFAENNFGMIFARGINMKPNSPFLSYLRKALSILALCTAYAFSAPISSLYGNNLYTDKKGKKAGDVVTVLVLEAAKAGSNTSTDTKKNSNIDLNQKKPTGSKIGGFPSLFSWLPSFGVNSHTDIDYNGKGATARNGELKATVTARITEVLDNGNLLIEGSKLVAINSEEEILEISGTIRADDINPDNTVYSYKIAEAVIRYSGSGTNSDAEKPGLITRFFNWIF